MVIGLTLPGAGSLAATSVPPGTISTVAGGVGGPGLATSVSAGTCGVTFDGSASLYIASGSTVRKVATTTDALTTPAGNGVGGKPRGFGHPSANVYMTTCGAAVASNGDIAFATSGYRVEVAAAETGTFFGQRMTAGHTYLLAGDGRRAGGGSSGPAARAALLGPADVAFDHQGNLVIADSGHWTDSGSVGALLQVVAARTGTFYGQAMKAGDLYTVAGNGNAHFSGGGGPAAQGGLGRSVREVAVDQAGNLVLASDTVNRVLVVAEKTGRFYGRAMKTGDLYSVAGTGTFGYTGDGGPAGKAEVNGPQGVAVDNSGNLVIADTQNYVVRVVAATTGTFYGQSMTAGDIYTVAGTGTAGFSGDGGPATSAEFFRPDSVAVDPGTGNLAVSDTDNVRVRLVTVKSGTFFGQAMTGGDVYTVAGNGQDQYSGDGGPATAGELVSPDGVTVTGAGGMVISDQIDCAARFVPASTGTFFGRAMTAGDIYTLAGTGTFGYSGDGGPGTSAMLSFPAAVAVDHAGNALIADSGNNRIRVVAAATGMFYGQSMKAGYIYTVAGDGESGLSGNGGPATSAEIGGPGGVAVDGAGNLVIAQSGNAEVRVVAAATGTFYGQPMKAGDIYDVAGTGHGGFSGDGGPATSAELSYPGGLSLDGAGNIVIADTLNQRVRVVAVTSGTFYGQSMTAGDIYTVAGDGTAGPAGDGGPATSAELSSPGDVAVDAAGNLIIADTRNNEIRAVAAQSGTFYGQPMKAGDIYVVAGTGTSGFSGDGHLAIHAELILPPDVAVNGAGDLLIADGASRVRMVTG
jgi:hypothetical protein